MIKVTAKITCSIPALSSRLVSYAMAEDGVDEYKRRVESAVKKRTTKESDSFIPGARFKISFDVEHITNDTIIEEAPLWVLRELTGIPTMGGM